MEQLPDDILAAVLGRLPPSSLAASRCVRKHWCGTIDARRLLPPAHLLPLRLSAFFCISLDLIDRLTYLFARPSTARRRIPGGILLDFIYGENYRDLEVDDHCNGLLLVCGDMEVVANPATRQWASLPDSPEPSIGDMLALGATATTTTTAAAAAAGRDHRRRQQGIFDAAHCWLFSSSYLVYDPVAESTQHFEVFLIPLLCRDAVGNNIAVVDLDEQEWPPSTFRAHVFSSRRWRWEQRTLVRHGEPAGTMADMLQSHGCWDRKAVYFRGALYVHCQNDSVMRISLFSNKYQMMRSPATRSKLGVERATFYLGKSEKGVYSALLYWVDYGSYPRFRVWLLKEEEEEEEEEENGDGHHHHIHMEWVLKTDISLPPLLAKHPLLHSGSADDEWRVIYNYTNKEEVAAAHGDDEFAAADDEWNFDNAHITLNEAKDNEAAESVDFLGFHPYKEIVFFSLSSRTISYNLNTSKVQHLGDSAHIPVGIRTCFPYTPCWLTMGELFQNS